MRDALNGALDSSIHAATTGVPASILAFLATVLGYLPWLVLIPIFALFFLKDAEVLRTAALGMLPRGRVRGRGHDFVEDVHAALAAYVRAQVVASTIVGIACLVGFALIGVPYAVVLGIAAGVLEFIPLAGPLTIGAVAVVFSAFHSPARALSAFLFLVVLRILQDYVVYPRIIGRGIHLHPLAVIVAILCGAELAGLPGIFLAIPAVAVLSVAYRHWREHRAEEADAIAR
jgi:predicted PurR-regulated permease PerM